VQTQVNQVQTLQGALLGDLALEHQLRERRATPARSPRASATTSSSRCFERLERRTPPRSSGSRRG
jgi:hypothetical protein